MADTAAKHLHDVLEYLRQMDPAGLEGTLRFAYDGLDLRVDLLYRGSAAVHLPPAPHPPAHEHREKVLDSEEAAALVGLRTFLRSLSADRKLVQLRHGRVMVRLGYAA